ncbi:MAG TPA: hypothetical protein VJ579_02855 [Candidatus Paceibacterota bacterium]|nr:hypothetical protein [Candidatus Paceibacterota bacterium]
MRLLLSSLIISLVGVFVIDYFSHLIFSDPMETLGYFWVKAGAFFLFSLAFLKYINLSTHELHKVMIGGIVIASLWGMYYNVFPLLFEYYPYGIALNGLSFLGMGIFGTGVAFGIVHTLAFTLGYYTNRSIISLLPLT